MNASNLSLCRWHPQENLQCSHFTSLWRDGRELCAELLFAYWTYRFLDVFVAVVARSGGSFSNDDGDGNENVKKSDYIRLFSLYVYLLSRLRRENTLFHVLWRTLTSDDEYLFLFSNLSAVSKKSERNSPTFSAKWNKRDKVWKTRIHYKVTFSLPWPSSSLKLLSFVRFLNSRDPFF